MLKASKALHAESFADVSFAMLAQTSNRQLWMEEATSCGAFFMHSLKMPSASSNKPQCVLSDTGEETKEFTQNTGRRCLGCLDMFVRACVYMLVVCMYLRTYAYGAYIDEYNVHNIYRFMR